MHGIINGRLISDRDVQTRRATGYAGTNWWNGTKPCTTNSCSGLELESPDIYIFLLKGKAIYRFSHVVSRCLMTGRWSYHGLHFVGISGRADFLPYSSWPPPALDRGKWEENDHLNNLIMRGASVDSWCKRMPSGITWSLWVKIHAPITTVCQPTKTC